MATKQIILHTNARVNGVLRSPPEGAITVTEGEAKRLVQQDKVAKLAPGEKWTAPRSKPAKATKTPAPAPAAAPAPPAPASETAPAPAAAPADAVAGADQPQG